MTDTEKEEKETAAGTTTTTTMKSSRNNQHHHNHHLSWEYVSCFLFRFLVIAVIVLWETRNQQQQQQQQQERTNHVAASTVTTTSTSKSTTTTTRNDHIVNVPEKCFPQNIHWSPVNNNDENDFINQRINMTLSFTLPFHSDCNTNKTKIPTTTDNDNSYNENNTTTIVTIFYDSLDNDNNNDENNDNDDINSQKRVVGQDENDELIQFDFHGDYHQTFSSSFIHHVRMPNLHSNCNYWYKIQVQIQTTNTTTTTITTPRHIFKTPPTFFPPSLSNNNNNNTPMVTIAMVGDWGMTNDSLETMKQMINASKDLSAVIIAGDLSYANSYLPKWEHWLSAMEPLFRSTSLLVAPGNHEMECDQRTGQIFQAYESYFRNPNRIGPAEITPVNVHHDHDRHHIFEINCTHPSQAWIEYYNGNSYYSYRLGGGMIQMIVLNSYVNTTKGSRQYNWLQQELHHYNETYRSQGIAPWLFVVFHCPFHTTFHGHNNETNPRMMMQDMEPLFVQYKVNVVVSGHNHAYVRSHPMIGNKIDIRPSPYNQGIVYFTLGTGGIDHSKGPIHPLQPEPWVAHRDHTVFGFGEFQIYNHTHLYFQRVLNNDNDNNDNERKTTTTTNIHDKNDDDVNGNILFGDTDNKKTTTSTTTMKKRRLNENLNYNFKLRQTQQQQQQYKNNNIYKNKDENPMDQVWLTNNYYDIV